MVGACVAASGHQDCPHRFMVLVLSKGWFCDPWSQSLDQAVVGWLNVHVKPCLSHSIWFGWLSIFAGTSWLTVQSMVNTQGINLQNPVRKNDVPVHQHVKVLTVASWRQSNLIWLHRWGKRGSSTIARELWLLLVGCTRMLLNNEG